MEGIKCSSVGESKSNYLNVIINLSDFLLKLLSSGVSLWSPPFTTQYLDWSLSGMWQNTPEPIFNLKVEGNKFFASYIKRDLHRL